MKQKNSNAENINNDSKENIVNTDENSNKTDIEENKNNNQDEKEKSVVQKIEIDDRNFEYNDNAIKRPDDNMDINLSDDFDDRLGSSDDFSGNDSIV